MNRGDVSSTQQSIGSVDRAIGQKSESSFFTYNLPAKRLCSPISICVKIYEYYKSQLC